MRRHGIRPGAEAGTLIREPGDLGRRLFAFAVISDTHVNADDDSSNAPYAVNARSNRRFRHVVADLNQRDMEFVVHLGDLVHPVPETGALYSRAAATYREIASELKVPIYHAPGNHDIGDMSVKSAPASPITEPMIEAWKREFGPQWQAFTHGGIRFVLLNAQLINSGLPDEARQKEWVETELADAGGRVMLLLHHPPYLCFREESNHYDNTAFPGRAWVLGLMGHSKVEAMFAGHVHNFWYDRFEGCDYYLSPATSFLRHDYSELQRIAPAPDSEFGRNDGAKLGYLFVSVYEHGHSVQIVRTDGTERDPGMPVSEAYSLAPTPRENANPGIGFDLRRNWAEISEIPPSGGVDEFDRKLARNDYPLLALVEMGIRDIRIPLADLRDPNRRERLKALNHLGFRPTLFGFGVPPESDLELIETCRDRLVDWEMTVRWPLRQAEIEEIAAAHERTGLPIYLSRTRSKRDLETGSVYYHVINHGFVVEDIELLDQFTENRPTGCVGAVFRLGNQLPVHDILTEIDGIVSERGLAGSVHLRVAGDNPAAAPPAHETTRSRVLEAIETSSVLTRTRVFCDTFMDIDRGYFPRFGAIDAAGNQGELLVDIRIAHARRRDGPNQPQAG